ncbi:MAG: cytochrome P460 family protein [Bryobacteraceae bacterium]|nr:cytochrome P460 family protein [Bryobacteraceae bacterium]
MKRILILGFLAAGAAFVALRWAPSPVAAAGGPSYTADGKLKLPTGYRKWVFIGAPLTPNGLNGGKAGFPEFHNVYVEDKNLTAYQKNGEFPEGTVIVKELVLLRKGAYPDGSADSPSGRGFAEGEFNGLDVTVKDSQRYAKTNKWGFYNFGHHALPYESAAKEGSAQECAGCHMAGASKTDMTWVDFYPVLRGKN